MSINVCEVKRSVISRSDGIPCVYLSPGTRLCLGSINASNMLNCFIFILQSPQYLWVIWGTGTFVVWGRKCKVKQHSDQGSRGEGLTIVFLWGCWKQEMFPNTSQTPKGKSRNKGVFSFCQTKDMLKLFCRGAWKYRVLFLPSQIIARRVGKFYFQKHHHIFRAVNCWCFLSFLFSPLLLFSQPSSDLLAHAYKVSLSTANGEDFARWTVLRFPWNWKEWPPSLLFPPCTALGGQLFWHVT